MPLSLIIIAASELEQNSHTFFYLCSLFFLYTKTNVVTNLKPLNTDNNSITLLLIADSVSLGCSSG